mgnify:CR=1 FL=1
MLVALLPFAVFAQKNFVENVQKAKEGWGKVDINQDPRLTKLVNNDTIIEPKQKKEGVSPTPKTAGKTQKAGDIKASPDSSDILINSNSAKIKRYKVKGFRVQIYAGSNSRNSRMEAEKTARRFKGYFPKMPVYTHFYPPRWVCRVGDFRTEEQAEKFMHQIRQLKAFTGVIVVKTAVLVSYRSDIEE